MVHGQLSLGLTSWSIKDACLCSFRMHRHRRCMQIVARHHNKTGSDAGKAHGRETRCWKASVGFLSDALCPLGFVCMFCTICLCVVVFCSPNHLCTVNSVKNVCMWRYLFVIWNEYVCSACQRFCPGLGRELSDLYLWSLAPPVPLCHGPAERVRRPCDQHAPWRSRLLFIPLSSLSLLCSSPSLSISLSFSASSLSLSLSSSLCLSLSYEPKVVDIKQTPEWCSLLSGPDVENAFGGGSLLHCWTYTGNVEDLRWSIALLMHKYYLTSKSRSCITVASISPENRLHLIVADTLRVRSYWPINKRSCALECTFTDHL